jgi:hypothetical protein
MDDLPDALDRFAARIETLERRVYVLEHPGEVSAKELVLEAKPAVAAQPGDAPGIAQAGGAFATVGKAMLGIAGAYLLRAIAESTSLPKLGVAAIAIAYAMLWLVWAARRPAGEWFASTTYACTSALILAPMLWELTLSFKVLPATASAAVLCVFVYTGTALAWRYNQPSVNWVATVSALVVALALSVATHELAAFLAALLTMAILYEYAALRNHWSSARVVVDLAADLELAALMFIYASPQSERGDYPLLGMAALLAPGLALFSICGASAAIKTVLLKQKISAFDTMQTMVAFLLGASSLFVFMPGSGAIILGIVCLALSAAGYAAVFVFFVRAPERRNERVFSTWSAALFLAGSVLCLAPVSMALWLGAAAIVAVVLGVHWNRLTLEFHGLAFLLAAAVASGLMDYDFRALAGTLPGAPAWSIWTITACAVICYVVEKPCVGEEWKPQALHFVSALVAIGGVAALLVEGLMWVTALRVNPGAHHLAFLRTLTICLAILALAFGGSHWRRIELTRIGYAALALVAVKLVFEDLRLGHLEFIAASIFLFAITLIAVPRIARLSQ